MRKVDKPLWKEGATPEERREIEALDKKLAKLREESHRLASQRNFIANRATVRARYKPSGSSPT